MPDAQVVEQQPAAPVQVGTQPAVETTAAPEATPPVGEQPKVPASETPAKPEDVYAEERKRHRRQLNTAYRKEAEVRARLELLQRENEELKKPKVPEGAPKLEQFDFDPEKYAAAREKYAEERALKQLQDKQRGESQRAYQERISSEWSEKVASTKHDDFHEVVGQFSPTTPLLMAVMEAGPEVAYYLVKNQAESKRIDSLPLLAQIREIGKLEVKLAAETPTPKTPSRAPAPITPVTGSTAPAPKTIYDPELPYDEFVRLRNKQLGRKSA